MATKSAIPAELRHDEGKGASRRLRKTGMVPAIVYGARAEPQSIQVAHHTIAQIAKNEWFYSSILDLEIGGSTQKVLLRDLQRHPFKPQILHLDFQRVSENEAIRLRVPLHFLNQESSPAGKMSGVLITHELNEVEVSCLPKDLPEYIEVDLGKLAVGDIVHLSDLKLPAGVSIPELKLGKEHDVAVVIARMAKAEEEPVAAEPAPAVPAKTAPAAKTAAKTAPAAAPADKTADKKK